MPGFFFVLTNMENSRELTLFLLTMLGELCTLSNLISLDNENHSVLTAVYIIPSIRCRHPAELVRACMNYQTTIINTCLTM